VDTYLPLRGLAAQGVVYISPIPFSPATGTTAFAEARSRRPGRHGGMIPGPILGRVQVGSVGRDAWVFLLIGTGCSQREGHAIDAVRGKEPALRFRARMQPDRHHRLSPGLMYWIIKLVQGLVKALNSEGTPGQVAAGMAVGACLGLTPLMSLHNLLVVLAILFFRVSVPGAMLGWLIFTPVGFLLDPIFDQVGRALLMDAGGLREVWATAYNTPVIALANPTNTIVVGSVVGWMVLAVPIFFLARFGVARYRTIIHARYRDARIFKAVRGSKIYNAYRMFRP
jgi:uncharacterized protein (TIGR03546 family)